MSLNILIASNVHWWNAEAAYAAETADVLREAGHNVFVLTRSNTLNESKLKQRGFSLVTHIELNTNNPIRLFKAYHLLKKYIQDHQIQVVNAYRSEGFFIFALLANQMNSFKLIRTRGTTRPPQSSWMNRKIYCEWTHAHIVTGRVVEERLKMKIPIPPEKISVIYYPAEQHALPLTLKEDYYDRFDLPKNALILSIVGRLDPVKGHLILLQSLKALIEDYPQLVLLILYRDAEHGNRKLIKLEEVITRLSLENHVRLIGPHTGIREIMQWTTLGIISSIESEVICRVAVEFFSVGTPVVAFPTGCLPELIVNGVNGYLTMDQTPSQLTQCLSSVLDDPDKLRKMRQTTKAYSDQHFSKTLFFEKTLHAINKTLEN